METEFKCELCGGLQVQPVLIPCCSSSVCESHIVSPCPICSKDMDISQVMENTILLSILQDFKTSPCQRCETKDAVVHCKQCATVLCKECSGIIHDKGIYKEHYLFSIKEVKLPDPKLSCDEHGLEFEYFCTDDWMPLCEECCNEHLDHAVLGIGVVLDEAMNEIKSKEQRLVNRSRRAMQEMKRIDGALQELESNTQYAKKSIEHMFNNVHQQLKWKEEEIMSDIESTKHKKKLQLQYQIDWYDKNHKASECVLRLLQSACNQNETVLLSSLRYLSHKIERALDDEGLDDSLVTSEITLNIDMTPLFTQIENLGSFQEESVSMSSPRTSMPFTNCTNSAYISRSPRDSIAPPYPSKLTRQKGTRSSSIIGKVLTNENTPRQISKDQLTKPDLKVTTPRNTRSFTPLSQPSPDGSKAMSPLNFKCDHPLEQRVFTKKLQSSSAIQVSWTHPAIPPADLNYVLEYGIGTKVNNIEQFRQVYSGSAHSCIITDLLPRTSYRFRVAASAGDQTSSWSEVVTIVTHDSQKINSATCGTHANIACRGSEKWVQFDKPGIVLAQYPYSFGKYTWEVKVLSSSLFMSSDSQSVLKIGVAPVKSRHVWGYCLPYTSFRGCVKIKVVLDCEQRTLVCYSPNIPSGETTVTLPEGPLYPAFHNKPASNSTTSVKFMVSFDKLQD